MHIPSRFYLSFSEAISQPGGRFQTQTQQLKILSTSVKGHQQSLEELVVPWSSQDSLCSAFLTALVLVLYTLSCRPVLTCDELQHGGVISRLYGVASMSEGAVICVGCKEELPGAEAEESWGPTTTPRVLSVKKFLIKR